MKKGTFMDLLMFSNVFRELSVSPSVVNSFKVKNLCKSGILKFGRILLHPQISWWVKN